MVEDWQHFIKIRIEEFLDEITCIAHVAPGRRASDSYHRFWQVLDSCGNLAMFVCNLVFFLL